MRHRFCKNRQALCYVLVAALLITFSALPGMANPTAAFAGSNLCAGGNSLMVPLADNACRRELRVPELDSADWPSQKPVAMDADTYRVGRALPTFGTPPPDRQSAFHRKALLPPHVHAPPASPQARFDPGQFS